MNRREMAEKFVSQIEWVDDNTAKGESEPEFRDCKQCTVYRKDASYRGIWFTMKIEAHLDDGKIRKEASIAEDAKNHPNPHIFYDAIMFYDFSDKYQDLLTSKTNVRIDLITLVESELALIDWFIDSSDESIRKAADNMLAQLKEVRDELS